MNDPGNLHVAVLLATYNGCRFIESQIESLKENDIPFTLHWIDDHSVDSTRETVRALTTRLTIPLREWHQPARQGVPSVFFTLLELVEADIYLFCDQDDVWQPGKIDITFESLLSRLNAPCLCFSDPLMFTNEEPDRFITLSDALELTASSEEQELRSLTRNSAAGHTVGFTRPLRDLFLRHVEVARAYAFMHDWWLYTIAIASGEARMLRNVPTTLYRIHGANVLGEVPRKQSVVSQIFGAPFKWRALKRYRRNLVTNAKGFIMASKVLPAGRKLERMVAAARLVTNLERRQSLAEWVNMVRLGVIWPRPRGEFVMFAVMCLFSYLEESKFGSVTDAH